MTSRPLRFPIGLTLGTALVVTICIALGVWQLGRAQWKTHELARIAAMKSAPPQPIGPVLTRSAAGQDVSFTRVALDCGGSLQEAYRLVADNGDWVARAMAACVPMIGQPPRKVLEVDRGVLDASRGTTTQPTQELPPIGSVTGVLVPRGDNRGVWPYILVAEHESPAPPGVTPAPYPDAAANLEYVGAYAPTWFGLAVVALGFYAALLWRRYHPKP